MSITVNGARQRDEEPALRDGRSSATKAAR